MLAALAALPRPALAQLPTCESVACAACGGELPGTAWDFQEILCVDLPTIAEFFPGCTGGSEELDVTVEGFVVFATDGAYTEEYLVEGVFTMRIPLECLPAGVTCEQLGNRRDATPTTTASECVLVRPSRVRETKTGTYLLGGATATLVDTDGEVEIGHFCIEGEEMTVDALNPGHPEMHVITRYTRRD